MAELEIDQTNLPPVREVCQSFAVLEDGVLANSLQEQEIEQYYTTNILKNQLVQNDIRVAKRLQDEEEQQVQQSILHKQASRQIEEQDFEYARLIQEELERSAEEAVRREQDDEEMAKQLQEEEEQRSREQDSLSEGSTSDPALPSPHQHTVNKPHQGEEQYSSTATRRQCSTSQNGSEVTGPQASSPRRAAAQRNTTSWSNQGCVDSSRQMRSEMREPVNEDSDDSDTVFNQQLAFWCRRLYGRSNRTAHQQPAPSQQQHERNRRRFSSRRSLPDEFNSWQEEETENLDEHRYENDDFQNRTARREAEERNHRDGSLLRSREQETDCRSSEDDDRRRRQQSENNQVWEMLGRILKERGVPVRFGGSGAPLQIGPQSRDSEVLHRSQVSYRDSQPHQRAFQRAAITRHSFHGDIRERRRLSHQENSGRDHREVQDRPRDDKELNEINRGDPVNRERPGSRRGKEHKYTNAHENGERNPSRSRVRRTASERGHWHRITEERWSSEEEQEAERRGERPRRRALQRSQSFSSRRASTQHRLSREAAGASLEPEPREASLNLGELQQVLLDEELARKLQQEEEKLLRRVSQSSSRGSYPEGDFRVAQVAQDEEIARFMQKQEIKSKRRSRELEGPASWQEHRAMISHHDRRATRERQVQRERLDSEGLPSPTDDCFPENQPPSPITTIPKAEPTRNVAEDLDPTFQARRQDSESFREGPTGPASGSHPKAQSGLHDFLEETTFIPPTKRQPDKPGRSKPKEKKEGCKQQ
ncbi:coiled-coil domain-containing protein 187 isoform X2 [Austrofundulus limnaeus]|uniref:Coiled-coil domain-containing protein 187 isoform X2 n=1 Tax=Austrofundulus limnaeus TaxID=52670 RepID=A0A2I4BF84_AUSLI|nr:PREDICTED: trichohyalin-like isoform X2 [Austrofundulus limnaeus]